MPRIVRADNATIVEQWSLLVEVLILLTAALALGTVAEQLRQSAIVGYLLAGALVGPNVFGLVKSHESVEAIADLGVALLLFSIGLEFSFSRLRRLGWLVLLQGLFQITFTCCVVMMVGMAFGLAANTSFALGTMAALSSTACVLRLLADRAEVESPYGRSAMGILLLQDAAVLPLTLVIAAMAGGGTTSQVIFSLGRTMLFAGWMAACFLVLFNWIVPRLLNMKLWAANREFPVLLAIVMAIGSAAAAHEVGVSPAMGAFLAGMLLAESHFAVQIRADVAPLKTALVTLFFVSIGMLSDPAWVGNHWVLVSLVTGGVVVGNVTIVWLLFRALRVPSAVGLAAGLCLAQIGEFSFVLARIARGPLIDEQMLKLVVSVTVITLFMTPYLVRLAPVVAGWLDRRRKTVPLEESDPKKSARPPRPHVIIVGFGPAGQRVAESLLSLYARRILVIDLNPRSVALARQHGVAMHVGNAGQAEVLEAAKVHRAAAVVITLPDPAASRQVIHLCRQLNPNAHILARARYHAYRWELAHAGAEVVVDEEEQVGQRLAAEVRRVVRSDDSPTTTITSTTATTTDADLPAAPPAAPAPVAEAAPPAAPPAPSSRAA